MEEEVSKLLLSIMEGYKDSTIPPLTDFSEAKEPKKEKPSASGEAAKLKASGRTAAIGVRRERTRRDQMTRLCETLRTIVPKLHPKAQRTEVVEETTSYIRELEETLKMLEARKQTAESKFPISVYTERTSSINVTASGNMAFFGIIWEARPGLATDILQIFESHKTEVLASGINCHGTKSTVTITALINPVGEDPMAVIQRIKNNLLIYLS